MTRPVTKPLSYVTYVSNLLHGRPGFRVHSKWGYISVLEGGGHICELISHKHGLLNPMWKPHWTTMDPPKYDQRKHARIYGPPPEGRLLAGIAGHSISFDYFGPPSPEEIAAGHNTHGEAPVVTWQRKRKSAKSARTLVVEAELIEAQMRFQRSISLDQTQPIVYCEETAVNLASFDRPICWNQHVTFGPPFLEVAVTLFDMPATRSKVCPASFSSRLLIRPDSEFRWPKARKINGGFLNLRASGKGRFAHYTAHLLDSDVETAFIAACNPHLRLLVLYLFVRRDFPWVGNWEERYSRAHVPWEGREFCRGFEFSSTPFPIPRRSVIANGELFGESTYKWLPAKSSKIPAI
jgi:hypothetical protein